jgi:hypothetical protein
MYPPIFATCAASAAVKTLIGSSPVRLYPFGEAPQGVALPYVVWQTVYGAPENVISGTPSVDSYSLQVDVYAETGASARSVAEALRDAIEPAAHIVGWRGESRDRETQHYRFSFDVDWWVER